MPPRPEIFFGRDNETEEIVTCVLEQHNARIAILGAGGMGKTDLAVTVATDPRIKKTFSERTHFMPGQEATTVAMLLELLAKSVGVLVNSNDRLVDVMQLLEATSERRLILLDNFETPCDIEARRPDVEDVLCRLASVPHVAIIVTMRSENIPTNRLRWTKVHRIQTLPPSAARALFIQISPNAEKDSALNDLLAEVGFVALAVVLLAEVGASGETPTELLARWRQLGRAMAMVDLNDNRRGSVSRSIEFSLQSNVVRRSPDALKLLRVVALLPGGARRSFLPKLSPDLTIGDAARTLMQASLAYHLDPGQTVVQLLPPIRRYILEVHPASDDEEDAVFAAYFQFLKDHASEPGDEGFKADCAAIAAEESNLEAILPRALKAAQGKESKITLQGESKFLTSLSNQQPC